MGVHHPERQLFQHTIDLSKPNLRKPPQKPKAKKLPKKATPKTQQTERHPEQNPTKVKARAENGRKYEQKRPQTPERKELQRRNSQARRAEAKSLGLCRGLSKPSNPRPDKMPSLPRQAQQEQVEPKRQQVRARAMTSVFTQIRRRCLKTDFFSSSSSWTPPCTRRKPKNPSSTPKPVAKKPSEATPLRSRPKDRPTGRRNNSVYHNPHNVLDRKRPKGQGKYRSCSEPAIPGQLRCTTCAEQHREKGLAYRERLKGSTKDYELKANRSRRGTEARKTHKKLGRCVRCPNPSILGETLCTTCRKKHLEQSSAYRRNRKAQTPKAVPKPS